MPGRIIEQQLAAIARIEHEIAKGVAAKGEDARSVGVRERLQKARAFYADLREKMARTGS